MIASFVLVDAETLDLDIMERSRASGAARGVLTPSLIDRNLRGRPKSTGATNRPALFRVAEHRQSVAP
jgi:hypothetical protein